MRRPFSLNILLSLIAVLATSFVFVACIDCVRGSGPVIREERKIEAFSSVHLESSGRVFISKGDRHRIAIEAQENILAHLETKARGGKLIIRSAGCFWGGEEIYIFIETPELDELEISGSGTIESEDIFMVDNFEMGISGSGSILMQLDAADVVARISGSGDIRLEGKAQSLRVAISGSGDLRAADFHVKDASIKIAGSGDARVRASHILDVLIAGSGDVYYYNTPQIRYSITGSGSVHQLSD